MRTKYDLAFIAATYFLSSGYSPTRPVTPDDAHTFAANMYSLIVGVPSNPNWKQDIYTYLLSFCNYHGIDIRHAAQWLNKNPSFQRLFVQYMKDHFRIETNSETIARVIAEATGWVGQTVANALWNAAKPLIPLVLLGFGAMYLFNRASTKRSQ